MSHALGLQIYNDAVAEKVSMTGSNAMEFIALRLLADRVGNIAPWVTVRRTEEFGPEYSYFLQIIVTDADESGAEKTPVVCKIVFNPRGSTFGTPNHDFYPWDEAFERAAGLQFKVFGYDSLTGEYMAKL